MGIASQVLVIIMAPCFGALLGLIWKMMCKRLAQNEKRIEKVESILQNLQNTMQNHLATVESRLASVETDLKWIREALKTNLDNQAEIFRQIQTKQDRD